VVPMPTCPPGVGGGGWLGGGGGGGGGVPMSCFFSQSHISENKTEVKLVKEMFPDYKTYTEVYHKHKLLTSKVS